MSLPIIMDVLALVFCTASGVIAYQNSDWHALMGWSWAFISDYIILTLHWQQED